LKDPNFHNIFGEPMSPTIKSQFNYLGDSSNTKYYQVEENILLGIPYDKLLNEF